MATTTIDEVRDAGGQRLDPREVCTLTSEEMGDRLTWIGAEILPHAERRSDGADFVRLELHDVPGLCAKLDRLVELERDCCAEIEFAHGPGSAPGTRWLEIRGVDPQTVLRDMATDRHSTGARQGLARRIARAAGVGTLASLFVCCVLPIAAVALIGGATASALGALDQPVVIAGAALLFGGAAFLWRRRPSTPSPVEPDAGDAGCGC
jgi:hypothetical protein